MVQRCIHESSPLRNDFRSLQTSDCSQLHLQPVQWIRGPSAIKVRSHNQCHKPYPQSCCLGTHGLTCDQSTQSQSASQTTIVFNKPNQRHKLNSKSCRLRSTGSVLAEICLGHSENDILFYFRNRSSRNNTMQEDAHLWTSALQRWCSSLTSSR